MKLFLVVSIIFGFIGHIIFYSKDKDDEWNNLI